MTDRIAVNPDVVRWAVETATAGGVVLTGFRNLDEWMQGAINPTFNQLTAFARVTSTPLGCFFLDDVPTPELPIADFRTRNERHEPSPELLDTIALCAARQDWYASYLDRVRIRPPDFVGMFSLTDDPRRAASVMRSQTHYTAGASHRTQQDALRTLIDDIESSGVLVSMNSVVENKTHRRLDHREFQGFTLVDPHAPLIFINGDDTKNARMFTLAHELAHVFLGAQGVSSATPDVGLDKGASDAVENWCNAAAAEFLVPFTSVPMSVDRENLVEELERLSRRFNVSTLVILRRLRERQTLTAQEFWHAYEEESLRLRQIMEESRPSPSGGDAYHVMPYRISRRLARAVYADAYEGGTTYRDAYRLLSTRTAKSFNGLAERLEVG